MISSATIQHERETGFSSRHVLGVIMGLALTGCGAQIRAASAGHMGCSPDEVVISDKHTGWSAVSWKASCRGADYSCVQVATGKNSSQVNCSPMRSAVAASAPASGAAEAPQGSAQVAREYDEKTKQTSVRGTFKFDAAVTLVLSGAPQRVPGRIAAVAEGKSSGALDQCRELSVLINAQPLASLESAAPQQEVGSFRIESSFADAPFQELSKPFSEFALRACDTVWKFSAAQVEELKKLLVIYRDLGATAPAASGGEST